MTTENEKVEATETVAEQNLEDVNGGAPSVAPKIFPGMIVDCFSIENCFAAEEPTLETSGVAGLDNTVKVAGIEGVVIK